MNATHTLRIRLALALLFCSLPLTAWAQPGDVKVGDPAPDVTLALHDDSQLELRSLKGTSVLIYFYPADETPGCTAEAIGFRDTGPELEKLGIRVIGVSMQDAASHRAFIENHGLTFPLAVDDGTLARAFGVPVVNNRTARQSFLIGVDGTLQHIWREVDPRAHAAEVLSAAGGK